MEFAMNKYYSAAMAVAMLAAGSAKAEEGVEYNFSGFGTIGAVRSNTDDAQYRTGARQNKGAGKAWDLGVESRLGLQGNVQFNSMFSAVGQVLVSRRDGDEVEWLFGQAHLSQSFDLRLGRMVLPAFMLSDTRNVGFASHWINAPHEVYDLYPLTSFDGLQAVYRTDWNGVNLTVQPSVGGSDATIYSSLPGAQKLKFDHLTGVNLSAEYSDWTVRYGTVVARNAKLETAVGNQSTDKDKFNSFGVQYDNGSLLVLSEFVTRRQSDSARDSDSYYVSTGYRFGPWLPYVSFSKYKPKGTSNSTAANDSTRSIGVRWDAAKNVAVKAQFESSTPNTQFIKVLPAVAASNDKIKVFSLAADFVF